MKHKTNNIFLYITIVLLSISSGLAQEICTNGVDDDGDGFIDCYDGDCAGGPSCADFFYGNPIVCKDEPTENPTFTMQLQWGSEDRSADSHATPAVGDLDNDGLPEVVVINRLDERLFILNGEDGTTAYTYDLGYQPENGIVLANLDGGDCANIYISRDNSSTITALDCEANFLWQTNASDRVGIMGAADFDGDGNVELYYKTEIMDAATGTIVVPGTSDNWVQNYAHSAIAIDILDDGFCADCSGLELITGNQIWAINIAAGTRTLAKDLNDLFAAEIPANTKRYYTKYFNTSQNRTAISVADYNQDGHVDVLMPGAYGSSNSSQTTIFFWDVFNDSYLVYDGGVNHSKGTGRLNVSDIDGDGQMNTTYVSDQILYALDENLNVLWTKGIDEGSSGFTGTTVFDFDGDGAAETIYRSESYLYIIDGTDGSTRTTVACKSRTQEEYPLVADVDNDGSSELCVPCYTSNSTPFSPYSNTKFSQIRIYEASGGEIWQPSRRVWNQHGYFNVNVNDDLTIPAQQQDHTAIFGTVNCDTGLPEDNRALNGFLNQSTFLEADGCPSYVSPDLNMAGNVVATPSLCPFTTFDVSFDIENTGDTDIFGTLPVTFYNGDPETAGATKLNTETVVINNFLQGETLTINMTVEGSGGDFDLYISINNNGQDPPITPGSGGFPECDFSNNIANIPVTYTPFTLTVNKLEENRRCDLSKPDNGEAEAYFQGTLGGDYETIWVEDFAGLSNGDRSDAGSTAWTSTKGSFNPTYWGVNTKSGNKVYRTRKTGQNNEVSEVTWLSEVIDISGYTDVDLSLDMLTNDKLEASGNGRDYMRAFYILDGGAETQFDVNGELYGSFLYAVAEHEDLNGSTLQIKVTFHTTGNGEYQYLDNVQVSGTSAPVVQQYTDADGFEFDWYNAGDFSAPVANGSLYTGMPTGSYDVVGYFPGGNCYSDTVNIVINDSVPTFNVHVYEVASYTDCANPDGALSAFVYTQTDGSGDPADTLTSGYSFSWVLSTEGITPVGTGPDLTNISSESYTVRVEQLITGCTSSASDAPSSSLIIPADPTPIPTDIITCSGPGSTGSATVSVGGITAGYTFEWFYENVDATPDYTGTSITSLPEGTYYVKAIDNGSSCESGLVTMQIQDLSGVPTPNATSIDNTSCTAYTGEVSADGDGAGTTAGYNFTWYAGKNDDPNNELPAAIPGATASADGSTISNLPGGYYTVVVEQGGCIGSDTVFVDENFVIPEFTFSTAIDTEESVILSNNGYVELPQLFGPGNEITNALTISYWANLTVDNYNNDERIFSSGSTGENQVLLWSDNHNGLAFVVRTSSGGRGRINSGYSATGWAQIVGTWDGTTGEMKMYVNGVLIGTDTHIGSGILVDTGNPMYLGRDGNIGSKKFEGELDEVRIYNKALTIEEINTQLCTELTGTEDGLVAYYDFNNIASPNTGTVVPDLAPQDGSNDAVIRNGGAANISYPTATITCPNSNFNNNRSCDVGTPNGEVDLSDKITPAPGGGVTYDFEIYSGFTSVGAPLDANTTGLFTGLAGGFYTVIATDQATGCVTLEGRVSLNDIPDNPAIATTITDDTSCDTFGSGEIAVTSSSNSSEPGGGYTYEIFDGFNFTTEIGSDIVVPDGSVGHTYTGLTDGPYRIRVTNNTLTCTSYVDVNVGDNPTNPSWNHASTIINDNTTCLGTPNGFVSVAVTGGNTDYTFEWYDGAIVDPGQLIAGETDEFIDELSGGQQYTVVATSTVTGCSTPAKTVTVNNTPVYPNVVTVEVQPQHSCDVGDGILRAYVDEPDPSDCVECVEADDYSFAWFLGNDTSTPLLEATDPGNNSNPTDVDSSQVSGLTGGYDYTVQVTNNLTGCTNEATISLTYDPQSPTIDPANSQIGANTLCGSMGNGSIIAAVDFVGETINGALNDKSWQVITDCNTETDLDSQILPDGSIELTEDLNNKAGKAYLGDSIDFSTPTRIDYWMYLGDKDAGADGITFIFHQDPQGKDALGRYGCNLGIGDESCFGGTETAIQPSVAIEFDTYRNGGTKDPTWDHMAFIINGDMSEPQGDVGIFYNADQPRILDGQDDVEDADTELRVTITIVPNFDGTQTFSVYVEEELRLQRTQDFINDIFGGNPMTIGGFTASTGGSKNQQYVRLDPYFGEYDFDWYTGSTADPANLIPDADKPYLCDLLGGEYTMVVTYNQTGCTSSPPETFIVPNNTDTAYVSFSGVSNTVCDTTLAIGGNFTGSLTANIVQDPSDYTFAWFEGTAPTADTISTNQTLSDIPGGDYTVVVESLAGGCISIKDTTLVDVTVDPAIINVNADVTVQNVTSCEGSATYPNGSIDIINVNGSGGPYGYLYWFGSDTTSGTLLTDADDIFDQTGEPGTSSVNVSGTGTATLTNLSAGDYTIIVIDSLNGCTSIEATVQIIDEPTIPDLEPNITDNSVCDRDLAASGTYDGEIAITTNDGSDPVVDYTYAWYDGTGVGPATAYTVNANILSEAPDGNYTVVATNTTTGCDTTIYATIGDISSVPTIDNVTTQNVTSCGGTTYPNGSISVTGVTGDGPFGYMYWYGADTTTGTFLDDDDDIFTQIGSLETSTIDVSGNGTMTLNNLSAGDYTIIVIDSASGCTSVEANVQLINVPTVPDLDRTIQNNTVCDNTINNSLAFDGQITITTNDGTDAVADYTYAWYDGTGVGPATAYTVNDNVLSEAPDGNYTVVVTSALTGCDTTMYITIDDNTSDPVLGTINVTPMSVCDGGVVYPNGSIDVDEASIGAGDYSFEFYWGPSVDASKLLSDGDNIVEEKTTVINGEDIIIVDNVISNLDTGFYTIVAIDNATGCKSAEETVEILQVLVDIEVDSTITNLTSCITPNGEITVVPSMASGPEPASYSYQWYYGSGTGNILDGVGDPGGTDPTTDNVSGLEVGTYTVEITNDETGCSTTREYDIADETVNPVIAVGSVISQPNTHCSGTPTGSLDPTSAVTPASGGSVTYTFELLDTGSPASVLQTENGIFDELPPGNYQIRATINETGCVSTNVAVTVGETLTSPDMTTTVSSNETNCSSPNGEISISTADPTPIGNWDVNVFRGPGTGGQNVYNETNSALSSWVTPDTLSSGTYTIQLINNETGCDSLRQRTINKVLDSPVLNTSDVVRTHDTYCTTDNGEITVTADDSNIANNAGADPIFRLYAGSTPSGAPIETAQPGSNTYTFDDLSVGAYTVTIEKSESGCESNGITRNVNFTPVTFTPTLSIYSDQTSCDLTNPNGEIVVSVDVGTTADYVIEWYLGTTTNSTNEIPTNAVTGASIGGPDGERLMQLPAGTYTAKLTDPTSGCFYTDDITIINRSEDPVFTVAPTPNPSTQCIPPNGSIDFEIDHDGNADGDTNNPYDGAADYTVELFDGPTIGPSETPLSSITAVDRTPTNFTGLEEGTFSIRATDNNTGCSIDHLNITIGYTGEFLTYDPANVFKDPLSPGSCFDQDGILDFVDAVSGSSGITGNVIIHWYIGTDTTNKANLVRNAVSGVVFSSSVYDPFGDNITIDSSRMENLPAISYTGVIEYANGCREVFSTDLTTTDAPDVQIIEPVNPTRCDITYNGSFKIRIDPAATDAADEFNYFVFEGDQTIAPHSGNPTGPYDPDLDSYGPLLATGTFASNVLDDADTITVDQFLVADGLDSGTYTVAVEINDADRCIVAVETITLAAPPESVITLDPPNTFNNTTCDVSSGLFYNGQIQVNANNPAGGTFDFDWYRDGDNDGDFSEVGPDGQIDLNEGGNSITGFNVVGSSSTGNTATITGLGPGWYRVIAVHNDGGSIPPATACPDTFDIQIFDETPSFSVGNSAGTDWILTSITDCGDDGSFILERILVDGAVDINYDTEAEIQAAFDLTWRTLPSGTEFNNPNIISDTEVANLTEGDYRIEIEHLATGCETTYDFTIDDITEDPVLVLTGTSDNTICAGGALDPNGRITVIIEDEGGTRQSPAGYDVQWYKGSESGSTRVPQDLEAAALVGTSGDTLTLELISGGDYFVVVTDNASPSNTCSATASSIVVTDNPAEVTIQTTSSDIDVDPQINCDLLFSTDGRIEVLRVLEDGVNTTPVADYTFSWYESDMATSVTPNLYGVGIPTFTSGADGPIVENLPAGTYYVGAVNDLTDCPTTGLTEIVVLNNTTIPSVQITQNAIDTSCDDDTGAGTRSGTGRITASVTGGSGAYTYTWYEGDGTTTTDLDLSGPGANVIATGYSIIGASGEIVNNLPDGTYYVEVTDAASPGAGCLGSSTITIQQFTPVISIGAKDVDYSVQNDVNCGPAADDNGSITLIAVTETQVGGTSSRITALGGYTFNWYDDPTGGVLLGSGSTFNGGTGLSADTYYVEVINNSSECTSSTRKAIVVDEVTSAPLVQLVTKTTDDYCVGAAANQGTGSLTVNINHEGSSTAALANYDITWYRGSTANPANELFIVANQGSADDNSTVNQMILDSLATGTYTVSVSKIGTPNDGCATTSTFSILRDVPTYSLPLSAMTLSDNLNCDNPNGSITIDGINIDGAFVDFSTPGGDSYTINWSGLPGGHSFSSINHTDDQVTGLPGGTYTVDVTNDRTNCTVSADITIDDDTSDPLIQLVAKTTDDYCVGAAANQGTGSLTVNINHEGSSTAALANYEITWYRGSTATPADSLFIMANQGSADDNSTATQMILDSLATGTYTVTVAKNGAPNDVCTTTSTFSIIRDVPTYSLPLSAMTIQDNLNCDNPNGAIRINGVEIDGIFQDFSSPTSDPYSISWSAGTPQTVIFADDSLSNLASGTYVATVTNNRTNCSVSASISIMDVTTDPLIQLVLKQPDEYCDNTGNVGNGSLEMRIVHEGNNPAAATDYDITWYRGSSAIGVNELFIPANQGSALSAGAGTQLSGLAAGTYTVTAVKNSAPNDQCISTTTFSITSDPPQFSIQTSSVDLVNNTNCITPNGSIQVTNVIVDGVAQDLTDPLIAPNYAFSWPDGTPAITVNSPNDMATGLAAGTYRIIGENVATGCTTDTINVTIIDDQTEPNLSFTVDAINTNCGITKNGQLTVTATTADSNPDTGVGRYSFTWYDGQGTATGTSYTQSNGVGANDNQSTLLALDSGYYTVTVYDNVTDCDITGTYAVSETLVTPQVLLNDIVVRADSTCDVGSSGTIIVADSSFASGVLDDYDVQIRSNTPSGVIVAQSTAGSGNTDLTISSLDPGTYYVTATLASTECVAAPVKVIILDERFPPVLTLDSVIANINCGGGAANGQLMINADGFNESNPAYTFQWYVGQVVGVVVPAGNGGTTASPFGLSEGYYTVEVTNSNTGCTMTQTFEVPVTQVLPTFTSYEVNNNTACVDNGSIVLLEGQYGSTLIDSLALATDYTIGWYSDAALTTSVVDPVPATPLELELLGNGTYYVTLTNDTTNCTSEPLELVIVDNILYPSLNGLQLAADSTCMMTGTPTGSLRVIVDNQNNPGSNYTFTWYEASDLGTPISNNDTLSSQFAGDYVVEVTNTDIGCTSTETFTIQSRPVNIVINDVVTTAPTSCMPPNGIIEVTEISYGMLSDYTFEFRDESNNVLQSGPDSIYNTADAGKYLIYATHNTLQCTNPLVYSVVVNDGNLVYPDIDLISFENQTNCDPGNPNGEISASADGSTDNTAYTFEWRDASNNIVEPNNATVTNIPAGTYTLNVTDNTTGCMSSASFDIVDDYPDPIELVISTSPNTNCVNPNGEVSATIRNLAAIGKPITDYVFYWFNGDQTAGVPDIANPDYTGTLISNLLDGDYTVYVVDATDAFCTSEPTLVTIQDRTFPPPFQVDIQNHVTICYDSLPDGRARVNPESLEANRELFEFTYEWYNGSAADTTGQTPFVTGIRADSLDVGTYSVLATDLRTGCENLVTFDIIDDSDAVPAPDVNVISDRDNCAFANGHAVASISGTITDYRFEWFLASGDTTTVQFTGHEIFTLDSVNYTVRATRISTGCISPRTPVEVINAIEDPVFEINTTTSLCLRTEDGAFNQFTGTAELIFSEFGIIKEIDWIAPDGTVFSNDIKLVSAQPGIWEVRFVLDNDCEYYGTFGIQTALKIYNGVSANADGLNDYFFIDCIDYFPNNNVQIFNRDGTKVWESDSYNNNDIRFDGFSNVGRGGLQLPAGTYFYIIEKGPQNLGTDDELEDNTIRPRIQGYLELVR